MCDDSELIYVGLKHGLEQVGLTVVGHALSAKAAIDSIRTVVPDVVLMDLVMPGMNGIEASKYGLSARELEVLSLLVKGASNKEIASALTINHETVKTHGRHIFEKLMVADRT